MALTAGQKLDIITTYGRDQKDTGSTGVQIALLTARIEELSGHLQENRKDHHSRRGLLIMVGKRKRLLGYLEKTNYEGYRELIQNLGAAPLSCAPYPPTDDSLNRHRFGRSTSAAPSGSLAAVVGRYPLPGTTPPAPWRRLETRR